MGNVVASFDINAQGVAEVLDVVKGESVLAKLSKQVPIMFRGSNFITVDLDKEADLVGESASKSIGGATVDVKPIRPLKFEYGIRVSREFILSSVGAVQQSFMSGMSKKFARALDIAAIHGVNPRTGVASPLIGDNCFTKQVGTAVEGSGDIFLDVNTAINAMQVVDQTVTGAAFSPVALAALANTKDTTGRPLFEETGWGLDVQNIKGLPVVGSSTVSFGASEIAAIVGDFGNGFRYGVAATIPVTFIEFGDPDGTGRDLARFNEIYIRAEIFYGWCVLVPEAFVLIKVAEEQGA
jgi:HK97 family phage major capsid protein